ncbi:MAG: hypothetical protein JEZ11_16625 [Desulfobacterales bacterium]|nr:hypothetical protein [Desulfobacterales bacterium]
MKRLVNEPIQRNVQEDRIAHAHLTLTKKPGSTTITAASAGNTAGKDAVSQWCKGACPVERMSPPEAVSTLERAWGLCP